MSKIFKPEGQVLLAVLVGIRDQAFGLYKKHKHDDHFANAFRGVANEATRCIVHLSDYVKTLPEPEVPLPRAYLIHGINGAGQRYIHNIKLTNGDPNWAIDEDGLGDHWSGNEGLQ